MASRSAPVFAARRKEAGRLDRRGRADTLGQRSTCIALGRPTDGDGLRLPVRASGEPSWVLRYRLHGRQRGEARRTQRAGAATLPISCPARDRLVGVKHQPALPWSELPAFFAALMKRDGMAPLALRFLIISAARTAEVRGLQWREISWTDRVWVVPAERMKMRELHRVPISDAMLEVLQGLRAPRPRLDGLVFPSRNLVTPLSDMALTMLVSGMASDGVPEGEPPRWRDVAGRLIVPHGFRSSFRAWCGETREECREVAERALAHVVRGVEGAYARSDLLERRRALMDAWGRHCVRLCRTPVPSRTWQGPAHGTVHKDQLNAAVGRLLT